MSNLLAFKGNLSGINLPAYGDILAIPMFLLSSYYFYKKENRNSIENLLLIFSIVGFMADVYFTFIFLKK